MKKFLLIVLAAMLIVSCQKNATDTPAMQDVSFTAIQLTPDVGLKSGDAVIDCKNDVPDYAAVKINNVWYYPALFTLGTQLYTQAIKLPVGNYAVQEFFLYKNVGGTASYDDGDIIVFATPLAGVDFDQYITHHLPYNFTVTAFTKAQLEIEVLCFQDHLYTNFGFDWFAITEIIVREQCFFGDLCVKHPGDYHGSDYENQSTGLQIDMPAIVQLKVYRPGVTDPEVFTNDFDSDPNGPNGWGVGAPVCVTYPDNLSISGEQFTIELWIMVKQGNAFPFVKFHTWTFTDANMIPAGDDGVVDFVLGSCNLSDTDLQLAPWQNLPVSANVSIVFPSSMMNSYWDVKFNSYTPAGVYDLPAVVTPWMQGWCGDKFHTISTGSFDANIYSSLNNSNWPAGMPFTLPQIAQVNWLMNNLNLFGYNLGNDNGAEGGPLQQAVWNLLNGTTYGGDAGVMSSAASSHGNFVPLPGGWAAVLVVKNNQPLVYQLIFVLVDP